MKVGSKPLPWVRVTYILTHFSTSNFSNFKILFSLDWHNFLRLNLIPLDSCPLFNLTQIKRWVHFSYFLSSNWNFKTLSQFFTSFFTFFGFLNFRMKRVKMCTVLFMHLVVMELNPFYSPLPRLVRMVKVKLLNSTYSEGRAGKSFDTYRRIPSHSSSILCLPSFFFFFTSSQPWWNCLLIDFDWIHEE